VEDRGCERGGIEAHVREDVSDFQKVGEIRFAGTAELVVVALGGNLVSAANHPGIFGGTILAKFFEELFEARVQLAHRAIAVEAQREVARRRHVLVYAGKGASGENGLGEDSCSVNRDPWKSGTEEVDSRSLVAMLLGIDFLM
jgi:hypothetical protein